MAKATSSNGGENGRPSRVDWLSEKKRPKRGGRKNSTSSPSPLNFSTRGLQFPAPASLICRLGVIADVQAADRDDAPSFSGVTRRYRDALLTARDLALSLAEDDDVEFLLHLGDLVDMSEAGGNPREVLASVLAALSRSGKEQAHVLGNHCLGSWPGSRGELHSQLALFGDSSKVEGEGEGGKGGGKEGKDGELLVSRACPERGYYSRTFGKKKKEKKERLRLVPLDGFDVSVTEREPGHPKRALAEAILTERNPRNEAGGWFSAEGLTGADRRFVCFNGGCGAEQIAWLRKQLEAAEREEQKVVVAVHQPLLPGTADPLCLLWNYAEVLETLRPFGERGTVVATFAGHAHSDGAGVCEGKIVHRVVRGVVEHARKQEESSPSFSSSDGSSYSRCCCHAVVDVFDDGSVVIKGRGCDDTEHFRSK